MAHEENFASGAAATSANRAWPGSAVRWTVASAAGTLVYLRAMAVFLVIWHLGSMWIDNPILLPSPLAAVRALFSLFASGDIWSNVDASVFRLVISFALAVVIGVPLGFAMGISPLIHDLVDPLVELLRPISGIAWIPLGMFILGVGELLPIAIMFYGAVFPIVINTVVGVRSVDPRLVQAAEVLGVGRPAIIRHVLLPAALPNVLVGARLGAGSGWMAMVAAELIGAPSGLGFAIEWYRELLMTPKVLAFVFLIGLLGYLFDRLLRAVQGWATPWALTERAGW